MAKDYSRRPGASIEPVTITKNYAAEPAKVVAPIVDKQYSPPPPRMKAKRGSGKAYTAAGVAMRERSMLEEGMTDA